MLHDPVTCPCCGLPVHRPNADALSLSLDLPAGQAAVLKALMAGRGEAVSAGRIIAAMRDDTQVDPRRAYRTALEAVSRLRPVVKRVGLEIVSAGYGQGWSARWID